LKGSAWAYLWWEEISQKSFPSLNPSLLIILGSGIHLKMMRE
jgi:hypothetical protein